MAPLLFKTISRNKRKIKHNPFKSELFAVGLIVLEAGLLSDI